MIDLTAGAIIFGALVGGMAVYGLLESVINAYARRRAERRIRSLRS